MTSADQAARTGALFVPRPDLATLVVSGPDRLEWLQGVLTCDVADLSPGDGRYGLVLTRQGKILSDVLVVATKAFVLLGVSASARERVLAWLLGFLVMEDAEIADGTTSHFWALLHGPRGLDEARRLAAPVGGDVGAVDPTGLGGAALVVAHHRAADLLAAAAAPTAGAFSLGDAADWERLRIERLLPVHGVDVTESQNPHEARLDRRAVSWDKGCYLGQEAVCMLEMRGKVKRRLSLLELGDAPAPALGTPVFDEAGAQVGETRSSVESEVHGGAVALAVLEERVVPVGTRLVVDGRPAVVAEANR
ncbi:MAG TPA: folate-binding protein YgfZ [Polyangiaceae bacterium]|nr:folate-binding protein YgfZ [Polyangiaceae bacterium]